MQIWESLYPTLWRCQTQTQLIDWSYRLVLGNPFPLETSYVNGTLPSFCHFLISPPLMPYVVSSPFLLFSFKTLSIAEVDGLRVILPMGQSACDQTWTC